MERINEYCPECGRRVITHDGRGTIPIITTCKNCKKQVIYYPEDGTIIAKPKKRTYSSCGRTFL